MAWMVRYLNFLPTYPQVYLFLKQNGYTQERTSRFVGKYTGIVKRKRTNPGVFDYRNGSASMATAIHHGVKAKTAAICYKIETPCTYARCLSINFCTYILVWSFAKECSSAFGRRLNRCLDNANIGNDMFSDASLCTAQSAHASQQPCKRPERRALTKEAVSRKMAISYLITNTAD